MTDSEGVGTGCVPIPKKDPKDLDRVNTGLQVPRWLLTELDALAVRNGFRSRNELVVEVLKSWVLEEIGQPKR